MQFFERQQEARKLSRRLVALYILAFLVTVAVIGLGVPAAIILLKVLGQMYDLRPVSWSQIAPMAHDMRYVALFSTVAVSLLIALPAWERARQLRRGSARMLAWMGAVPLPRGSTDPDHQRLRNVVEEMSIASGISTPSIHVFEREDGINAMAIGFDPEHAALAVTRGCLLLLDRDELQAVVAHEFSHILNGDMRLNTRLLAPLYGLIWLSAVAGFLSFGKPGAHTRGGNEFTGIPHFWVLSIPVWVLGAAGAVCSRAIKARTLRHRERLADASAVQFTRQTAGIAGALKKMAALTQGARFTACRPEEASHMLFGDGLGTRGWLSTHPPVLERIRTVQPGFHPHQLAAVRQDIERRLQRRAQAPNEAREHAAHAIHRAAPTPDALPVAAAALAIGELAAHSSTPGLDDMAFAHLLHQNLPQTLTDAASEPASAQALVVGLLLSVAPTEPDALLDDLDKDGERTLTERVRALLPALRALHPLLRLPLLQIAVPALRELGDGSRRALIERIENLIHASGKVATFEYALGRMLQSALEDRSRPPFGNLRLVEAEDALATLLAVLAHAGYGDEDEARRAWLRGMSAALPGHHGRFPALDDWVHALDIALPRLDRLNAPSKELLLDAMLATLRHDGVITVAESELLRAICATLHCPLPPLPGQR